MMPVRSFTTSEGLFAKYLDTHKYDYWRIPEGASRSPDCGVRHFGTEAVFEVKEFAGDPLSKGFTKVDTSSPVRQKIKKAAPQFRNYKHGPCCIVLQNSSSQFVPLDWKSLAGAMFGDLAATIPIGGLPDQMETCFLDGAKLGPQSNTSVSAVLVVHSETFVMQRASLAAKEEYKSKVDALRGESNSSVLVVENPHAANPLPRTWFTGPWDERFGLDSGELARVFVGSELEELENLYQQRWGVPLR